MGFVGDLEEDGDVLPWGVFPAAPLVLFSIHSGVLGRGTGQRLRYPDRIPSPTDLLESVSVDEALDSVLPLLEEVVLDEESSVRDALGRVFVCFIQCIGGWEASASPSVLSVSVFSQCSKYSVCACVCIYTFVCVRERGSGRRAKARARSLQASYACVVPLECVRWKCRGHLASCPCSSRGMTPDITSCSFAAANLAPAVRKLAERWELERARVCGGAGEC